MLSVLSTIVKILTPWVHPTPVIPPATAAAVAPVPCPPPPMVADVSDPLRHPDQPLPAWVADDPLVQHYRALLGSLPWDQFPERPPTRPTPRCSPWPGPRPDPRAPFVAAYLIKLDAGVTSLGKLRTFLIQHPALSYWVGFPRTDDPAAPHGIDWAATVPTRRHFGTVVRTLRPEQGEFLLTATVHALRDTLPADHRDEFAQTIALDTQAVLAWVKENNPKQYVPDDRRLDKTCQPPGDPDCALGVKSRRNRSPHPDATSSTEPPTPTTEARSARAVQVGRDILWGYGVGVVATRMPDGTDVVLAAQTRPFNESDVAYFFPLMAQVEARLGYRPRNGTLDAAYDAHYVYDYFDQAGGIAAVPINPGKRGADRAFATDGAPLCAAGLPMPQRMVFWHRTTLVPHQREQCACPLMFPVVTGAACPINDPHMADGGCTTTIAVGRGSRIRHQLDRTSAAYKDLFAQRTSVERINSQAEALGLIHPHLRRGTAIANQNLLTYVLINLRALQRIQAGPTPARMRRTPTTTP